MILRQRIRKSHGKVVAFPELTALIQRGFSGCLEIGGCLNRRALVIIAQQTYEQNLWATVLKK